MSLVVVVVDCDDGGHDHHVDDADLQTCFHGRFFFFWCVCLAWNLERNEWRDAFAYHAIYSTDSDPEDRHIPEHLPIQLLPRVVRALGQTPNPAELEEIEQLADPDSRGFFAFGDLVKAMDFLKTRVHDSQDLIAAFETMSEGGVPGKIKYDVLREKMRRAGLSPQVCGLFWLILTKYQTHVYLHVSMNVRAALRFFDHPHCLDLQELDQMVKDGDPDPQGLIDYNEFIQRMLAVRNQSITRPPLVRHMTFFLLFFQSLEACTLF